MKSIADSTEKVSKAQSVMEDQKLANDYAMKLLQEQMEESFKNDDDEGYAEQNQRQDGTKVLLLWNQGGSEGSAARLAVRTSIRSNSKKIK